MKSFITRYPLAVFFGVAYATSFAGFTGSVLFPSGWWAVFVYGPFIGAFIVIAVTEGRAGLRTWLRRMVRWRVPVWAYLFALLLPVALQAAAFQVNRILGVAAVSNTTSELDIGLAAEFVFVLLFIGVAEEPGFRGFALHRLLTKRPPLAASLILGVLHSIWHLPLFVSGAEPIAIVPIIISGSVLLTWLYVYTRGSVLLTMCMHASVNTSAGYVGSFFSEDETARYTLVLAVVYILAAIILVGITGPRLSTESALGFANE